MDDEDGYFGERVAAAYDESSADMFDPAVADAVGRGAGRARRRRPGAGAGHRDRPHRAAAGRAAACRCTASTCPGRWWPGCAPSRAATRSA